MFNILHVVSLQRNMTSAACATLVLEASSFQIGYEESFRFHSAPGQLLSPLGHLALFVH